MQHCWLPPKCVFPLDGVIIGGGAEKALMQRVIVCAVVAVAVGMVFE